MLVEDVKIGYWLNGKFIHSRTTTRDAATTLEGACGGPRLDPGSSEQRWHELEPVRDPLWSPAEVAAQYDKPARPDSVVALDGWKHNTARVVLGDPSDDERPDVFVTYADDHVTVEWHKDADADPVVLARRRVKPAP
jgi:hypothetical protein